MTTRRGAVPVVQVAAAVLLAFALALAGCGREGPKFRASDVTGSSFGREFTLTDHNGKARTLADFRGKVVVLFFGYTQCPDICPTTLATLAEAKKRLGPDGDKVQITIHQKIALGRAGLQTYAIDFSQQGAYTVVTTQNRSMPPELAAKMQYDIARWKRGETNCSKEMPKVTASAPAPAAR